MPDRPLLARLSLVTAWVMVAIAAIPAARELAAGLGLLDFAFATNRIEAFVADGVFRVRDGLPLYTEVGARPWVVHVYHPGTYLPTGLLARLLDLDAGGTLLLGRSLAAAAALGLLGVLAVWMRRATATPALAALVVTTVFALRPVTLPDWHRLRPETLALLLTFGALLVLRGGSSRARLGAAAALALGAFLVKQPFVVAPIAGALWLFASGERREAAGFAGLMAVGVLLWLALAPLLFGPQVFANTVGSMAANEVHPLRNAAVYGPMLAPAAGALALAALLALPVLLQDRRDGRLLALWLLLAAAWAFWTAGKRGAGPSYFSETALIAVLAVGLATARCFAAEARGLARPAFGLVLLSLLGVQLGLAAAGAGAEQLAPPFDDRVPDLREAVADFADAEGPQLVSHERLALALGEPEVLDWYLWDLLIEAGVFDPSPLLTAVRQGEYGRIALSRAPTSQLERAVFSALQQGPYVLHADGPVATVWRRAP